MTPAETIARCALVELRIGPKHTPLAPVVTPDGQLNSLQTISPPTEGGGYLLAVVEPVHDPACPALAAGGCTCGAQGLLEAFVFKT